MEEVKKEFIPLPDVEADPIGAEYVRSGSEPSDPLPSRMTREYSEFLHRFDDADPFERSSFGRPLFDGTDTDSSHGESENSSSFDLPVEVIPAAEELEAAVELSGFENLPEGSFLPSLPENAQRRKRAVRLWFPLHTPRSVRLKSAHKGRVPLPWPQLSPP